MYYNFRCSNQSDEVIGGDVTTMADPDGGS